MAGLQTTGNSLIKSQSPFSLDIGAAISALQSERSQTSGFVAQALEDLATQTAYITKVLQSPLPSLTDFTVTSPVDGSLIFWAGWRSVAGTAYAGAAAANLWIGPGADPTTAPFFSDGTQVAIGKNGSVSILDPIGNVGAWLGTQSESPKNVTGAANNGSGAIRMTVTGHGYVSGDEVYLQNVGGTTEADGSWVITVIDADHFDLIGSTFTNAYTSGGTSTRFYAGGLFGTIAVGAGQRISGVANNGSGLIRVTVTAHGYATGYEVVITGVNGVSDANGYWLVTVVDADHFDLNGSAFSGAYVDGGIALNWPTAKLIARADGSLSIKGAEITLNGSGATISLDPTAGTITETQTTAPFNRVTIQNGEIDIDTVGATFIPTVIQPALIHLISDNTNQYEAILNGPLVQLFFDCHTQALAEDLQLSGYSGSTAFGPLVRFSQFRGTGAAATATQSGDTIGGIVGYGFDGTGESQYPVGLRMVATENHAVAAHGSKLVFEVTPTGSTVRGIGMTLDQDSSLNVAGGYLANGTAGVTGTLAAVNTGSGVNGLTVTTGTAVTSVTGAGISTTTGSFVTGVSLATTSHNYTQGLVTS